MSKTKTANEPVSTRILSGLKSFAETLENNEPISEKFNCRNVMLDLQPPEFGPEHVKATRELLGASQGIFAQFIGVKVSALQKWEQGRQEPGAIACRFLDEIERNPTYWRKRLKDSIKLKEAC
ncbi:MAG: hypothetical protein WD030_05065 [Pirellulales bacterium]